MKRTILYGRWGVLCLILSGCLLIPAARAGQYDIRYNTGVDIPQPVSLPAPQDSMDLPGAPALAGIDNEASSLLDSLDEKVTAVIYSDLTSPDHAATADLALNVDFDSKGSAQTGTNDDAERPSIEQEIPDPLEPLNRVFFQFNDKLYFWLMKPVANAYSFVVPEWGRERVRNMFKNLRAPIRMANALLQLKMHKFGAEFASFLLNSTIGVGGLFDLASRHPELSTSPEDLGQTLGSYGLAEGVYLVLPVFGPSSLRDTVGFAGDRFLDPLSYVTPMQDSLAIRGFSQVNDTSFRIGEYEDIKESALDPYISIRDIYQQYRRNKVRE